MSSQDRERWDVRHARAAQERAPPSAGTSWLPAAVPGRDLALDLACGTGRNVDALVRLGYRVIAADVSLVALRIVASRFAHHGSVHPVLVDVDRWAFAGTCFDLVVQVNFLARAANRHVLNSIRSGGWLYLDTFAGTPSPAGLGPRDPSHRLEFGELRSRFSAWRVHRIVETSSDGGRASILAQKPDSNEHSR